LGDILHALNGAAREEDPYDAYGLPKIVKVWPAAALGAD
jgi:hypothetical protein